MAWIESHDSIGQHPKTIALKTALDGKITTAVGVLHLLWHFTLKFAWRDGDLSRFKPEVIADAIGWNGDVSMLFDALRTSGWMDEMKVHDWLDYSGKIVGDRLYNEKRRKTSLKSVKSRKSTATNQPNQPNQPTNQSFEEFWSEYPKKTGKGAAEKSWLKIKPTEELKERILKAVRGCKNSLQWTKDGGQYIPYPSTWLNQKRWEDEIEKGGNRGGYIDNRSEIDRLLDRETH